MKAVVGARLRPLSFSVLLALGAPHVILGEPVQAAQTVQRYDVPAGPLESTLTQIARQGGSVVSFTSELVTGKTSQAVRGEFSVQEALRQALAGTGLALVVKAEGVMTLQPSESGVQTLGAVSVRANRLDVTEGTGSYATAQTTRGKGMAWRETPQSVTIMTQQRIEDQALKSIKEVMDQTPGVTVGSTFFGSTSSAFYSRGFLIGNIQVDGNSASTDGMGYDFQSNLLAYDHVEVIRGADGLFAGNGEAGGSLVLARKRPTREWQVQGAASMGRWKQYQAHVDVGGPLAFDGRLRGRVVMSRQTGDSFLDKVGNKTNFFYGVLEAELTDSTVLSVGASQDKTHGVPFMYGLPRYQNGDDIGLPRSTSFTADWARYESKATEVFARLEQQLGSDWKWEASAYQMELEQSYYQPLSSGAIDPATLAGARTMLSWDTYNRKNRSFDMHLSGSFEALGRRHKLVVGADWFSVSPRDNDYGTSPTWGGPFDIFNPSPVLDVVPTDAALAPSSVGYLKQRGIYAKAQLSLTDRLSVILGGRWGAYENASNASYYKETGIFTPYGAVLYDLSDSWTAYASLTDIYKSQANRLSGPLPGTPLNPIEGRNYEVGIKGELLDGKLNAAMSLYHTTRNGQAVSDPSYPSTSLPQGLNCCYLEDGRVVSKGVDLEVSGEVWPGVQLMAGYTYNANKNKVSKVPYSSQTPRHLFKLWANWKPLASPWSFGAGVVAQSTHYVSGSARSYNVSTGKFDGPSVPFDFTQGGYAVWNARIGYELNKHASLSLNINNVFDRTYYKTVGNSVGNNWYGEPRNVILTLRASY